MAKYHLFPEISPDCREWPDKVLDSPPIWCSVDLRDGNQALPIPMSVAEKKKLFCLLCSIGFKEIEVGFPSASKIEYDFLRSLVSENMIPEDVTVQVLTQMKDELIEKTVESLVGIKKAIIHVYNSTSAQQRRITFGSGREEIKNIAVRGVRKVVDLLPELKGTEVALQYSPESFTGTELDFALEVCEAVTEVWDPKKHGKIILNLPATVELCTPNIHADQIEWFRKKFSHSEEAIISLHTHNDRGTGIAASELGLLGGAQRVEGTLFGNGERTGNADIVTLALNMQGQGIQTGLNLSNLPEVVETYERITDMKVPPRHPYAGELVFTAFSGSHQDAIKKGMDRRSALIEDIMVFFGYASLRKRLGEEVSPDWEVIEKRVSAEWQDHRLEESMALIRQISEYDAGAMRKALEGELPWDVPYLPIDPRDIGRNYDTIIRINSQSGKGGVAYILKKEFSLELPRPMHPVVGAFINAESDRRGTELLPEELLKLFNDKFVNKKEPYSLVSYSSEKREAEESTLCRVKISDGKEVHTLEGQGNGPIDAFVQTLRAFGSTPFTLEDYHEQALSVGASSEAIAYILIRSKNGAGFWGVGRDTDTTAASLSAVIGAFNGLSNSK